ncbi:hypothetical protein C0W59_11965 [Photobacterium kishitanii]|uniref:hypothetical protein n=1 Tax=Photobacterium kishitanii TaxID=318456 RepID=UPI000D16166A|nr:hypothetical protein [Photobacterium kishitanii]PSV15184.1 hypothetical protein C0W59_11965 [Photobacterium kishitanii]
MRCGAVRCGAVRCGAVRCGAGKAEQEMLSFRYTHNSPETGALTTQPNQSDSITGHGKASTKLKQRLDPITK